MVYILQDPKQLLLQNIPNIKIGNEYSDIVLTLVRLYLRYCYFSWCVFQLAIHQSMCNFYPFIESEFYKATISDLLAKLKFHFSYSSLIY